MGGRSSTLKIAKKTWEAFKWLSGWPLAIFSIFGIPDGLSWWSKQFEQFIALVDGAMSDPRVHWLASIAVEITTYLNFWPIRAALFLFGVSIILWRVRPYRLFRSRIFFLWKRALENGKWIDKQAALDLIRASDWARVREPPVSIMDAFASQVHVTMKGVAPATKTEMQFRHFILLALRNFEIANPYSVKMVNDKKQYSEDKIIEFTERAFDDEVIEKFGKLPSGNL